MSFVQGLPPSLTTLDTCKLSSSVKAFSARLAGHRCRRAPLVRGTERSALQCARAINNLDKRRLHLQQTHASSRSITCAAAAAHGAQLKALILDCDGVIVESEDIHREAYNAAFAHFRARTGNQQEPIKWSEEFYDDLQNKVGGGKAKMRWFFGEFGWPTSTMFSEAPQTEQQQGQLIDALQEWKSAKYQEIIGSDAEARPGIMRLMDEARQAGIKLAVCSAATKSSVIHVVKSLLGAERFEALDSFLAGDDVPAKKPDPSIYTLAAEQLGVQPSECLVIEDSAIGLQAAVGAGMRCIITYTNSSLTQGFKGAELIVANLDTADHPVSIEGLLHSKELFDDRLNKDVELDLQAMA